MQKLNYDDLEEQAKVYKVTDEDVKHGKKFSRFLGWLMVMVVGAATGTGIWLGIRWFIMNVIVPR
jgi:hypothetical protein